MSSSTLFIPGKVVYVEGGSIPKLQDSADALRIKVRVDSDGDDIETRNLPWAFPAIPKFLHVIPKVGECVMVLNSELGNLNSQRFYIGPVISQPQFNDFCPYDKSNDNSKTSTGRGPAMSLLSISKPETEKPLASITSRKDLVDGSFPNVDDVAIIGRGQEDIILKYRNNSSGQESEIDLRTGIRLEPTDVTIPYLKGNVVFNSENPGYVQVKYAKNGLSGLKPASGDYDDEKFESKSVRKANSVVNVVADKINLISHKDTNSFGNTIADNKDLIKIGELDEIMSKLHRSVYGDELITLLKKIVEILVTHKHPFSGLPPIKGGTDIPELIEYDYEKILSPNVRIS